MRKKGEGEEGKVTSEAVRKNNEEGKRKSEKGKGVR